MLEILEKKKKIQENSQLNMLQAKAYNRITEDFFSE